MRRFSPVTLFVFLAVAAPLALAQTTGDIVGHVTDEQGGPIPGVTVEGRSPAFPGARTSVTEASGTYRLVLLPPGVYKVTVTLQGFARAEQTVTVSLAKSSTLDFRLRPALEAQVIVSGQAPTVDTTAVAAGTNFDNRQIRSLPTGRNFSSIVLVSPGVTTQSSNSNNFAGTISIYGSTGLENSFILDGSNTTGVEYGAQGTNLNYEFIQEVEVKTGGYQAEFGRSTGGIVNVITKSGGNEYHGDVFGYYNADSLQASNKYPAENLYGSNQGFSRYDGGADLGGYAWKDRVWFFVAYDRVKGNVTNQLTTGPSEGDLVQSPSVQNLASAKLTLMIDASNTLMGSFFEDPSTQTGAINDGAHTLNGSLSTFLGRQDFGGQNWVARYNGIFGSSWVVTAQYAVHSERNSVGPSTIPGAGIQYIDSRPGANNVQSGGFGLVQKKDFQRDFYGGSVSKYLSDHELKAGFEYETQDATVVKRFSSLQQVKIVDNPGDPSNPVYRHFYWSVPGASVPDNAPLSQLTATPSHKVLSAFLQDSWSVLPNLTVNAGLRWDEQKIYDSTGVKQIDISNQFAPRIGVIWDPTADHRTKVFGSFGYFYEQIPMDLVIREYSFEQQGVIYNFDPTGIGLDQRAAQIAGDDPTAVAQGGGKVLGGFTTPSDPNLKGQYLREFLVGGEREFMPNWAVGGKFIYRNYGQVIEDFLCSADGTYCVGNPGQGIMQNLLTLDYNNNPVTYPAPRAQRIYRGAELTVTKQFSDNWAMVASYLWSNLTGNYDGGFAPYTQPRGTADPNISAAYDYYDFFTNGQNLNRITNTGPLSNDRRGLVKLYGTYVTPFKLNIGLTAYYETGTPVTRLGYSGAYDRWEFFLGKRGADGRVPPDYEVDLHFGYPLQLGPVTVNALVDIFHVLNAQRAVFLDESYNTAQFTDANYICGTGGPDQANCNAYYKSALARTSPRSVRFGLRVSF